jgi:hypothetical protein
MKAKKLIFKIVNYLSFAFYLIVVLAFASGVSEEKRNQLGNLMNAKPDDPFEEFYNMGWEVTEVVYLFLLFLNILSNLVFRKRFRKNIVYKLF